MDMRPWRSVLYIPGDNSRALEKARGLACDAIIFDLEDAVAPTAKAQARETLAEALGQGGFGGRGVIVRINGLDTEWFQDDIAILSKAKPPAVLLPKVMGPGDISQLRDLLHAHGCAETEIWAMMETPSAIMHAAAIAQARTMSGFVLGTNDLAKELRCQTPADRLPLMHALQTCVLAARGAGIVCIDGVFNAFKDDAGLRYECEQGRALGMDGKSLIHPAQLAVANEVFAPDQAEIDLARAQIAAFEEAASQGRGVAVLDGKIIENLHVETARHLIAKTGAIAALEEE